MPFVQMLWAYIKSKPTLFKPFQRKTIMFRIVDLQIAKKTKEKGKTEFLVKIKNNKTFQLSIEYQTSVSNDKNSLTIS